MAHHHHLADAAHQLHREEVPHLHLLVEEDHQRLQADVDHQHHQVVAAHQLLRGEDLQVHQSDVALLLLEAEVSLHLWEHPDHHQVVVGSLSGVLHVPLAVVEEDQRLHQPLL